MDSLTICGGFNTRTTCITLTSDQWVTSHALVEDRRYHSSWSTGSGILLLGGQYSPRSTEIVKEEVLNGVPGFPLQIKTE